VRPAGQHVGILLPPDLPDAGDARDADGLLPPLVAVLDGLPEANHPLLRGRLEIVDPDDLAGDLTYTSDRRRHGTMVASAVVWGDLGGNHDSSPRMVAIRPVMKPDMETRNQDESVPWNELPADITIRAVRDLVGHDNKPGATPTVRIVNLSIGDQLSLFDTIPSAWARAIDWLAFEHNILFVISAGNHLRDLPLNSAHLATLTGPDRDRVTADAIAEQSSARRLLPPAESMNAITVGALHADAAGDSHPLGHRIDIWSGPGHPSPVTAHGRGIRRSVKPDLAAPGGRQLYDSLIGQDALRISVGRARPPGVEVAAPLARLIDQEEPPAVGRSSCDANGRLGRGGVDEARKVDPTIREKCRDNGRELLRTWNSDAPGSSQPALRRSARSTLCLGLGFSWANPEPWPSGTCQMSMIAADSSPVRARIPASVHASPAASKRSRFRNRTS
jgi:hypothetical protein